MRWGRGINVEPDAAHERNPDSRNTMQALAEAPRGRFPGPAAFGQAMEHIVTADQPDRHDRIVVGNGQAGEAGAAFPLQRVLLALEFEHVPAASGEDEDGLALPHQLSAGVRLTRNRAGRFQHVTEETLRVADLLVGQAANPNTEFAVHEVGNQNDLGRARHSVIADEEEPPVARQVL